MAVYTTINDPSAQFQIALYTGNSSTQSVVNGGNSNLQPDLVWTKCRSNTSNNFLFDSNRGVTKQIHSDTADAEGTNATSLTAFNSDGWTMGNTGGMNFNSQTYVGWQWKCNGGTTSSNASGTITSTTQVNTTAGFSIVTYTGNGVNGATVGHGLGVAPDMMIVKCLSDSYNWMVYNSALGPTKAVFLDLTNDDDTDSVYWSNTAPTSGLISLGTNGKGNANTENYVAYCFAEKPGYSKFGEYFGNGSSDGSFVYCGFKPALIMIKYVSGSGQSWWMWDDKRIGFNPDQNRLRADQTSAEDSDNVVNLVSNGFKFYSSDNAWNDGNYIFMAFAENPFVTSDGVPTTAR